MWFKRFVDSNYLYLILFALSALALSINFGAKLGPIDDHETPWILGANDFLEAIIAFLRQDFENGRARPLYVLLRVIESYLWRDNAIAWVAARAALLASCVFFLFKIGKRFLPALVALGLAITLSLAHHSEIWVRLATNETYGYPLAILGIHLFLKGRKSSAFFVLTLSALCKESFLPLVPIVYFFSLLWSLITAEKTREHFKAPVLVSLGIWLSFFIWSIYTIKSSGQVYGGSMSLSSAADLALHWARDREFGPLFLLALCSYFYLLSKGLGNPQKKRSRIFELILIFASISLLFSQTIIYQNSGFGITRYQVPLILASTPLLYVIVAGVRQFGSKYLLVTMVLLGIYFWNASVSSISKFTLKQRANIALTGAWHSNVTQWERQISGQASRVFVVLNEISSMERAVSSTRFLAAAASRSRSAICFVDKSESVPENTPYSKAKNYVAQMSENSRLDPRCQEKALSCLRLSFPEEDPVLENRCE